MGKAAGSQGEIVKSKDPNETPEDDFDAAWEFNAPAPAKEAGTGDKGTPSGEKPVEAKPGDGMGSQEAKGALEGQEDTPAKKEGADATVASQTGQIAQGGEGATAGQGAATTMEDEPYKKRYEDLRGLVDRATSKNSDLERRLAAIEAENRKLLEKEAANRDPLEDLDLDEEERELLTEDPRQTNILRKLVRKLKPANGGADTGRPREGATPMPEAEQELARLRFQNGVIRKHANFEELAKEPEFIPWVKEQSQEIQRKALSQDPVDGISVLDAYVDHKTRKAKDSHDLDLSGKQKLREEQARGSLRGGKASGGKPADEKDMNDYGAGWAEA